MKKASLEALQLSAVTITSSQHALMSLSSSLTILLAVVACALLADCQHNKKNVRLLKIRTVKG